MDTINKNLMLKKEILRLLASVNILNHLRYSKVERSSLGTIYLNMRKKSRHTFYLCHRRTKGDIKTTTIYFIFEKCSKKVR